MPDIRNDLVASSGRMAYIPGMRPHVRSFFSRFSLWWIPLLAVVAAACVAGAFSPAAAGGVPGEHRLASPAGVPRYVLDVYACVLKNGRAPRGYVGGRVWQNREHRLPRGDNYREFDVHPKVRGVNRGAERIIVDMQTGKGWYTADHYRTFTPLTAP